MNNDKYSYNYKICLVKKISKIKNKYHLKIIYDIINNNNENNIDVMYDEKGININFENLSNIVYCKIDDFISLNYAKNKKKRHNKYIPYLQNEYPFDDNSDVKYSNKEKNIIKKKNYDKQLTESNEEQCKITNFINNDVDKEQKIIFF
jgi:hypothetical protein